MKKYGDEKSVSSIIRDKIVLLLVASGCLIAIFATITLVPYFINQMEWVVSVEGDDFHMEDTVDVFGYDGTYKKTIHCIRKKESITFIGNYSKYIYTIRGAGLELHPVIYFDRGDHDTGHQILSVQFEIYRNGDQWDATVNDGGHMRYFEDVESNEISIRLGNV